jgi:hypothetical protein
MVAAILLAAPAAWGDQSNLRPYLVGARAGGMGGAFTALADDPAGRSRNRAMPTGPSENIPSVCM